VQRRCSIGLQRNKRHEVEVELKLFRVGRNPQFQLSVKLPGTHDLDRYVPSDWSGTDGIPVVGHLGVTDPTYVFATKGSVYDPGFDAPVNVGFNLYANVNLVATDPADQDPWLDLVSRVCGVRNAALHFALGLPLTPTATKTFVLAELALQWRQVDVVGLVDGDHTPGLEVGMPCIETDAFTLRFSRSDFKVQGTLAPKPSLLLGMSTDLVLEIEENDDLCLEEATLIFTGGFEAELAADTSVSPTFGFTMNGTGRNADGKLTGNEANASTLTIDPPGGFELELRQLALEIGLKIVAEVVTLEGFGFVVDAQVGTISGRVATKVNLNDAREFLLETNFEELSLRQIVASQL
jgi:hypothetical protein